MYFSSRCVCHLPLLSFPHSSSSCTPISIPFVLSPFFISLASFLPFFALSKLAHPQRPLLTHPHPDQVLFLIITTICPHLPPALLQSRLLVGQAFVCQSHTHQLAFTPLREHSPARNSWQNTHKAPTITLSPTCPATSTYAPAHPLAAPRPVQPLSNLAPSRCPRQFPRHHQQGAFRKMGKTKDQAVLAVRGGPPDVRLAGLKERALVHSAHSSRRETLAQNKRGQRETLGGTSEEWTNLGLISSALILRSWKKKKKLGGAGLRSRFPLKKERCSSNPVLSSSMQMEWLMQ